MYAAGWVVLYLGTVVTGSGPHAGDREVPRNGLDPLPLSQLHADAVFLFVGSASACCLRCEPRAPRRARPARRRAGGRELAQGLIGFVQYVNDLPIVLVELHLLGAALLTAAMTICCSRFGITGAG